MKKKVISLFVTGMLAVSMIAGCGSDNTADTSTSADTTADASTDAAADTTAEEAPAATTDFDASEYVNVLSSEDGSGTRGAFIELFGIEEKDADGNKVDNTTEEAIITNSTSVMLTSVASDEYAIGYVSLGSLDDTVKAAVADMKDGEVILLENTRYRAEETKNGDEFSKELASLCDVFVNDAFGTAHRAHCSNVGVTKNEETADVG